MKWWAVGHIRTFGIYSEEGRRALKPLKLYHSQLYCTVLILLTAVRIMKDKRSIGNRLRDKGACMRVREID